MTTRFFRATGLLSALALVLLAGCDSADSGGLAPTANLDLPLITGSTNIPELCTANYSVAPELPGTGTFSIASGPGSITTQSSSSTLSTATVRRTGFGTIRLVWTRTGDPTPSYAINITGASGNACG